MAFLPIDITAPVFVDEHGRLMDKKFKMLQPEVDEAGYRHIYLPVPGTGEREKRYLHIEVARHHGLLAGPASAWQPEDVDFKDGDKANCRIGNLIRPQTADGGPRADESVPETADEEAWEGVKEEVEAVAPDEDVVSESQPEPEPEQPRGEFKVPPPPKHRRKDDFTRIKGVGDKFSRALRAQDIQNFRELSEVKPEVVAGWLNCSFSVAERIVAQAEDMKV